MAETILLLDSETPDRQELETFLTDLNFEVICGDSVVEADNTFSSFRPDLSIIEYNLSKGQGIEILNRFLESNPSHPVLIISENASPEQAVESMKAGAFDYLGKPINFEKLRILVEKALETVRRESHLSYYSSEKQQKFGLVILHL